MTAFLPELKWHFRLSSNVRLVFDAKGYMEDGDLNRAQVGPSLQFNIRPLEKLKRITILDMDDEGQPYRGDRARKPHDRRLGLHVAPP